MQLAARQNGPEGWELVNSGLSTNPELVRSDTSRNVATCSAQGPSARWVEAAGTTQVQVSVHHFCKSQQPALGNGSPLARESPGQGQATPCH